MSLGSRSGVHWMRANPPSIDSATTRAAVVLARPGHALDQDVAAGEQPDQQRFAQVVLPDHLGGERRRHRVDGAVKPVQSGLVGG